MKKTVFFFIIILLISMGLEAGDQVMKLRVIVQKANIREEPDTSAYIVAQVTLGSLLNAQTKAGDWYEVTLTGSSGESIIGYIHGNLVELFAPEAVQPQLERIPEREAYREPPPVQTQPSALYRERRSVRRATGFKLMGSFVSSKMTISEEEDLPEEFQIKSLAGFGGGIGFEIGFSPNIIFEIDFTYAPGGTRLEADLSSIIPGLIIEAKVTAAAITAPILLKIKFLRGTSPYIVGGGEIGYVISQKAVVTIPGVGEEEQDITEDLERLYYGALFGGGFEVDLDFLSLLMEFRYHMGLSNMVKDPPPDSYARSNAMSLTLGIKL